MADNQRGLGSNKVSNERRRQIAQQGGNARKKQMEESGESYSDIGRKGGETVANQRGSVFYSDIGKKGGQKGGRNRSKNQGEKQNQEEDNKTNSGRQGGSLDEEYFGDE